MGDVGNIDANNGLVNTEAGASRGPRAWRCGACRKPAFEAFAVLASLQQRFHLALGAACEGSLWTDQRRRQRECQASRTPSACSAVNTNALRVSFSRSPVRYGFLAQPAPSLVLRRSAPVSS